MGLFKRKNKKYSTDTMDNGAMLITVADPKNPVAEQFRTIRTNIHFMSVDKPLRRVAFTSSNVSEGKSTVTANVAITWAQEGKRVLLIDADLRRSTLHTTFGVPNHHGLTTVLTSAVSEIDLSQVIMDSGVENLDVLPAGPVPPNPSELLNSQRMTAFLDAVEPIYDIIVLDVPPLLEVTDTQALSGKLDGVILVVRAGVTQKAAVSRAVEMLKISKARLLGYVMNDADGKYMLLEFPSSEVPNYAKSVIFQLQQRGITPVIVHPERNKQILNKPELLADFLQNGCLTQLTASSYLGTFGKEIEKVTTQFIAAGQGTILASDAHALSHREYELGEGIAKLAKQFGQDVADQYQANAKALINGDLVTMHWRPLKKKKKFLGLF